MEHPFGSYCMDISRRTVNKTLNTYRELTHWKHSPFMEVNYYYYYYYYYKNNWIPRNYYCLGIYRKWGNKERVNVGWERSWRQPSGQRKWDATANIKWNIENLFREWRVTETGPRTCPIADSCINKQNCCSCFISFKMNLIIRTLSAAEEPQDSFVKHNIWI